MISDLATSMRLTDWFLEKISTWKERERTLRLGSHRKAEGGGHLGTLLQDPPSYLLASVPLQTLIVTRESLVLGPGLCSQPLIVGPAFPGPFLHALGVPLCHLGTHLLGTIGSQQDISFDSDH